ncbi:TlpA family protein disulfide reductase [Winogradskyella sp. Asnod2-B02-A]|uniref:TlpA family protein disulfide reductase n=1 Tax=Winogradskyella sp. Asnod2-B02-A TaxID=3160583 RepID=UPI00386D0004
MKKIFAILLSILIFGCKSDLKLNKIELTDFNLILQTNEDIDSVLIMDIGQQRENYKVAFNDTIRIQFNDSINDLYNIWFLKDNKIVSSPLSTNQLWLNGKNVVIKGKLDKKLIIDTIVGSDLYYKVKNNQMSFRTLMKSNPDSTEVNSFLLAKINDNFDNPYSLTLASIFISKNQNNKSNLKKLYNLIRNQNDLLKNHSFFNVHNELEKKLGITDLNIENYSFFNLENEIAKLNFEKEKKYLIDLWFVNCPPCIKDHKIIFKKLNYLESNNIELIGISRDKEHSKWKNYLDTHNYNWRNFRQIDSLNTITKDLGISAFPTYLLLENGGEIKITFNSFEQIENYLIEK